MQKLAGESYLRAGTKGHTAYLELDLTKAATFIAHNGKRILLQLARGAVHHRALQTRKNGYAVVVISKALLNEIKASVGDLVTYTITPDNSKYGMSFPEEFAEVLAQEPTAKKIIEELNPGKQRGVLHYIDGGKSVNSRINKALEITRKLLGKSPS